MTAHETAVVAPAAIGLRQPAQRDALEGVVSAAREARQVYRISMDVLEKSEDWARLVVDDGSGPRTVGQAHPHGEWLEIY